MIKFFCDDYENLNDTLVPASKSIPDWFKEQSSECPISHNFFADFKKSHPTIKRCPGILDYLTQGYILKMWEDIEISIEKNYLLDLQHKIKDFNDLTGWPYLSKSDQTAYDTHHISQFLNLPIKKNYNHAIKLINPWQAVSDKNIKLLVLPLTFENLDFQIIPGVIETSFYHYLHIPMLINSESPIFIKRETPLLQYIPFISDIDYEICSTDSIDKSSLTNWNSCPSNYNKLKK